MTPPEASRPSASSPSTETAQSVVPAQTPSVLGPAVTFGGTGTAFVFLARYLFDGETEVFFVNTAPVLAAVVSYFGKNLGFLLTDPLDSYQRRRKIKEGVKDKQVLLKVSCDALIAQRDAGGVSRARKAELNANIAEMERLFAEDLAERFRR